MRPSYAERDFTFGQIMLTLRTVIGLTQAGLANLLGVSRRTVGEWELGSCYPKTEHLKALIALGVKQRAFPTGHEVEEIRTLWKAAHQKVLLDEHWLCALLNQQRSTSPPAVSAHLAGEQQDKGAVGTVVPRTHARESLLPTPMVPLEQTMSSTLVMDRPATRPQVDWGDAQAISTFYGREQELALLSQWIVQERSRVVSVLGMGGIGKSVLSVNLMYRLAEHFEVVIFRSLRDAPSCEAFLDECLQVLSPQPPGTVPATLEQRISLLLSHLRKRRTLIVLDNVEGLLKQGNVRGHLHPNFDGYGQMLHQIAERAHQSCLLLTSREKPAELRPLESKHSPVHSLRLAGLDTAACQQLLMEKELVGTKPEQESLIEIYGGNPLALKIVAETIVDLFGGEIGPFLAEGIVLFGCIIDLLAEQFARLSALEQTVLCWLAIAREPLTLDQLLALLVSPLPRVQVLEAIDAGYRRSLIERGKRPGSFTLQSVVLEYVTEFLVAAASQEIQQSHLDRLIQHGLSQAHAKEYVRQTQEHLLLSPLLTSLQNTYRKRTEVEKYLLSLLDQLRKQDNPAQGYGPANLIALLRLQRGDLSGLDLSHLCVRGAYLQSTQMQDTNLSGALIRDTVFTEAVSTPWAVAISPDGSLWAAGSMQGKVRVWDEGGQTLRLIWQAHTDIIETLAFSPDGHTLASGSMDNSIKLWNVDSGTLLWAGWQDGPESLAFSPDGTLLACGGLDATVRLWNPQSGTNLQTLKLSGHMFAVAWSPDGHLLATGCFDGEIRLWERRKTEPDPSSEILALQTSWETSPATSLAFAPDGRTLASGHWDRTVKLWDIGSGRLLDTFEGQTNRVNCVAWSLDGHTLASCCYDKTIWLWDVESGRCRAVLHGHRASIYGIAFTPDSSLLLSGSADNTLRVWDIQSGQCVRVISGYAVSLYDIDWSPDGTQLVSGGTDGLVTIWDLSGETSPRVLCGHTWVVWGVGWSPDGRFLASSGWDMVMRLWNPTSGDCIQTFQNSSAILLGMAWSPDGSLLAGGTFLQGVQVWNVPEQRLCWVGLPHQTTFLHVAWSPDGTQLLSGCSDSNIYLWLWEGADSTLLQKLSGHHGRVTSVAWSSDGKWLVSGSDSGGHGELFVWAVQSGELVQTFEGHPTMIYAVAWSPGGDQLISGDSDGTLRWWDVQSRKCVSMRTAHRGAIRSLKVNRNGRRLASCGDDGAIRIWDLGSFELVQTLQHDRPYERLNITGIRGLNEAQKATLQALGALES